MKKKPSILFLSRHNAVRGQMAEAMLRHLAGDRFEVKSAGIDPKTVPALTHRVLEEELLGRFRRLRDSLRDRLQSWLDEEASREAVLKETALV